MDRLILTPAEVAAVLGTTKSKIQELLSNGEIPAYREGRNWKVPESLLREYIEERARKEAAERRMKHDLLRNEQH